MSEIVYSAYRRASRPNLRKKSVLFRKNNSFKYYNPFSSTIPNIRDFISKFKQIGLYSTLVIPLVLFSPAKPAVSNISQLDDYQKSLVQIDKNLCSDSSKDNKMGELERKLFIEEHETDTLEYTQSQLDLSEYFAQFSDAIDFDTTWKIKHAKKVFSKYEEPIMKMTETYGVPLNFFLAKLGLENGSPDAVSKTKRRGYSQIYHKSTLQSLNYAGKKEIKGGKLYEDYLKYEAENDSKKKRKILEDIIDDPVKNLEVGVAYCKYLYDLFGDWSISSAAYQIGPAKMAQVLHYHKGITTKKWWPQLYWEEKTGNKVYRNYSPERIREYVTANNLTITDLTNNESLMTNFNKKIKTSDFEQLEIYAPWVMKCASELPEYLAAKGYAF